LTIAFTDKLIGGVFDSLGMSDNDALDWFCKSCNSHFIPRRKRCDECKGNPMLTVECLPTGWMGSYVNYMVRHRKKCEWCNPKMAKEIEQKRLHAIQSKRTTLLETKNGRNRNHCSLVFFWEEEERIK
jgi:hypothetical protein